MLSQLAFEKCCNVLDANLYANYIVLYFNKRKRSFEFIALTVKHSTARKTMILQKKSRFVVVVRFEKNHYKQLTYSEFIKLQ